MSCCAIAPRTRDALATHALKQTKFYEKGNHAIRHSSDRRHRYGRFLPQDKAARSGLEWRMSYQLPANGLISG